MAEVEKILISPEEGGKIKILPSVKAIEGAGFEGDRYAKDENRQKPANQATFIEAENIEAFAAATGKEVSAKDARRNIVTSGIRLNPLVGRKFRVGDAEFEGLELCEPCKGWAEKTQPEVLKFFAHKGGLNARIIKTGTISVGDKIQIL
ncbi:MAG: MOSC domain-containing protein, partial [Candidatus Rifleibacteriota bacterium]